MAFTNKSRGFIDLIKCGIYRDAMGELRIIIERGQELVRQKRLMKYPIALKSQKKKNRKRSQFRSFYASQGIKASKYIRR